MLSLAALAFYLGGTRGAPTGEASPAMRPAGPSSTAADHRPSPPSPAAAPDASLPAVLTDGSAPANAGWRDPAAITLDDPLWSPGSVEEARWLTDNLYPSEAIFQESILTADQAAGFDGTEALDSLNLARAEYWAHRQPTDAAAAVMHMERSAASGSIYALRALSRYYGNREVANPVAAHAFDRIATMRGEWTPDAMLPAIDPEQNWLADLYAADVLSQFNRARARSGRPPLGFTPRPGLDELLLGIEEAQLRLLTGEDAPGP